MTQKEIQVYNVGFIGAFDSSRRNVRAYTSKEAKEHFRAVFGGSAGYVVCRHHDVVSLNDHRHCIDWYDAESGQEMTKANTGRGSMLAAGLINPGEVIL
jgi:hypothetical protein